MFTINEILDIAIRLETNSEDVYRRAAAGVGRPDIEKTLLWIAGEEARHAVWLANLKDDSSVQSVSISPQDVDGNLLSSIVGGEAFSLETVDFTAIHTFEELVAVFVESEQDGILFYEMLKSFVREAAPRNLLDRIITEEQRHIATFMDLTAPPPTA